MSERTLPSEIGGYKVVGPLGHGSYGSVFRVRRKGLLRDLALKVLPADLRPEDLSRFRREARLVARLDHPHVVRGFEFGRDRDTGWHYLCLDLVEGPSLKQHLKQVGPLPWQRAIEIIVAVARAVDYAHQQGVIHRDLKPANVLLDRHGFVRVADFGLARDLGELTLTAPGEVLGTPYYMSQEQVRGHKATPLFDVHALGVMLFELVTGERPYRGESIAEVVGKILEGKPPLPSEEAEQTLPPGFDRICQRAMAPEISQRYPSARALADALEDLERAQLSGAPLPLSRRKTPESVGLPAAAPRDPNGAVLGAGVAAAVLLPLLCLAVVWGWSRSAAPPTTDDVVAAAGQDPSATSTDAGPAADPAVGSKADLPRQLALTKEAIETWDLKRAKRELDALEGRATPATAREVETLKTLHAAAVANERAEIEGVLETYTKDLRGYAALDAALDLLRAHPNSAPLGVEAARLLAVCGEIPRANEVLKGALRIDPSLTDAPRTHTLLELLTKNTNLDPPSTAPAVWQRWRPYQGGVWSLDRGGALKGGGRGLGEYDLSGLLAARVRPSSPPYRLQVEVALRPGKSAYGGVLFGVSAVGEGYLAYLVRESEAPAKHCTPAEEAQLKASGRKPLFLRVARLEGGEWTSLGTSLCVAEDRGEAEIPFELEVRAHWVRATVGGISGQPVRLPAPVRAGEVGVLCFYDGPVTYRDFRSD